MDKKNEIKFSVVMPVYGVEKFIDKSIQSILQQTYKNYEIILVNDCTPDGSGKICKQYAKKYENIRYLEHEINKGLSEARNTGLVNSSGDYVLFLDSDDFFEHNMLEVIEESLNKNMADVVVYGISEEYMKIDNKEIDMIKTHSMRTQYFSNYEFRKIIIELEQQTLYGYAWNKAYRLEYLKKQNLKFENIKHIEDIEFNVRCFENAQSVNILEDKLYHYIQHSGQRLTTKKIENYFELQKERISLIREQHKGWGLYTDNVKEVLALSYFRYFFSALEREILEKKEKKQIYNFIKEEYGSDLYIELRKYCKPQNVITRVLYFPAKKGNYNITIFFARIIYVIKENFSTIFLHLKQARN